MDRSVAAAAGEDIVAQRGLTLPVDPFAVADQSKIEVVAKPTAGGVSGFFMRVGTAYVIAYSSDLANEGFERFSVAHELGHYFLPGHAAKVLGLDGVHESRAMGGSKEPHEVEADRFASGLLLPRRQFTPLLERSGTDLKAIESLATHCKTSLTMTALRVAECVEDEAVAVVVCSPGRIEFCAMSSAFRSMRGLEALRGGPVPQGTPTHGLVTNPERLAQGRRDDDSTHLSTWFGSGPNVRVNEEVVGLGRYGRTLTVLTLEEPWDEEADEEDRAIEESWTPTFSRSRRR